MRAAFAVLLFLFAFGTGLQHLQADDFPLVLRSQKESEKSVGFVEIQSTEKWPAESTAIIVCDVWDLHHCLNAVRRLEEFAPRLNQVLVEARRRGATIIHAPSDCMPAYENHPARKRALNVAKAPELPKDIDAWCSRIPSEEKAVYPIDQSDGGEDDDPAEHAEWAAKLKSLGRNPAMPWKKQLDTIEIDGERDYISDRGSEVWSILHARGIKNVILTGVHCNMCVLGRPFGLRQLARNGKHVVLMRDMTDCMYNPERWPFVDHFTGNDLIIAHVEKYVCPTITSDQIIGGKPFRSKYDKREVKEVSLTVPKSSDRQAVQGYWGTTSLPVLAKTAEDAKWKTDRPVWLRAAVRIPRSWLHSDPLQLELNAADPDTQGWLNGMALKATARGKGCVLELPMDAVLPDEANLVVLRMGANHAATLDALVKSETNTLSLGGRWQYRFDDDPAHAGMPLPARFGASPDILFEPQ